MRRLPLFVIIIAFLATLAWSQQAPPNAAPPRSEPPQQEESSSKQTKIDLSPPAGSADVDPRIIERPSDVNELHPWDPHKAAKDVEVGDFYFKRGNYKAAISRYEDALYWKPRDAIATFRLAQVFEKTGKLDEARQRYEEYLKILPHGDYAAESQKALERLSQPSSSSQPGTSKQR